MEMVSMEARVRRLARLGSIFPAQRVCRADGPGQVQPPIKLSRTEAVARFTRLGMIDLAQAIDQKTSPARLFEINEGSRDLVARSIAIRNLKEQDLEKADLRKLMDILEERRACQGVSFEGCATSEMMSEDIHRRFRGLGYEFSSLIKSAPAAEILTRYAESGNDFKKLFAARNKLTPVEVLFKLATDETDVRYLGSVDEAAKGTLVDLIDW